MQIMDLNHVLSEKKYYIYAPLLQYKLYKGNEALTNFLNDFRFHSMHGLGLLYVLNQRKKICVSIVPYSVYTAWA